MLYCESGGQFVMKTNRRLLTSLFRWCVLLVLLSGAGYATHAQGTSSAGAPDSPVSVRRADEVNRPASMVNSDPPVGLAEEDNHLTWSEIAKTLIVVILATITLALQFLLLRVPSRITPEESLRVFGVTLIITGTLFLITAGFSSQQIAPAMGLFGTMAGYLLGKREGKGTRKDA